MSIYYSYSPASYLEFMFHFLQNMVKKNKLTVNGQIQYIQRNPMEVLNTKYDGIYVHGIPTNAIIWPPQSEKNKQWIFLK